MLVRDLCLCKCCLRLLSSSFSKQFLSEEVLCYRTDLVLYVSNVLVLVMKAEQVACLLSPSLSVEDKSLGDQVLSFCPYLGKKLPMEH